MSTYSPMKSLLAFLLLTSVVVATRYSFSIDEIIVGRTRDISEDDLFLAIASTAGSSTTNKNFTLGPAKEERTIKWNNLTQEIDVPTTANNLSIALGLLNNADTDEKEAADTALKFTSGLVSIAALVPGPQAPAARLLDIALGFVGTDLFNCDGPVVIGNAVYAAALLKDMDKGKKNCETRNYAYESPKTMCGPRGSNYTVTHCLERLDEKDASSAAVRGVPGYGLSVIGFAVAVVWGSYGVVL